MNVFYLMKYLQIISGYSQQYTLYTDDRFIPSFVALLLPVLRVGIRLVGGFLLARI
jgi:hypothetical protein